MKIKLDLDLKGRAIMSSLLRQEFFRLDEMINSYKGSKESTAFKVLSSNLKIVKDILDQFDNRRSN